MLLIPTSRTYNMARFHLPRDTYNPNQGNGGWIEDDSDEEPMDDSEEENSIRTNSELQVYNTPQGVQRPAARQHFQGLTRVWGEELQSWSHQQGQCYPFGMNRDIYNISNEGSAERALCIIVHRIARQTDQVTISVKRILEANTATQDNTTNLHRLDEDHGQTRNHAVELQREMTTAQAVIRALREHQETLEGHLKEKEQNEAKSTTRRSNRCK